MEACARVPSPFGFTPRRAQGLVYSKAFPPPKLLHVFMRQAKDFFPYFAAVGGVSRFILQSCYQ